MRNATILALFILTSPSMRMQAAEEPTPDHKLVMIGNYVFKNHDTGQEQLQQLLGAAGLGSWSVALCMNDIHASLAGNWAGSKRKDGSWEHEPGVGLDRESSSISAQPSVTIPANSRQEAGSDDPLFLVQIGIHHEIPTQIPALENALHTIA